MPTSFGAREREILLTKLAFTSARKGSAMVSALRRMPLGAGAGAGSGPVSAIAVVLVLNRSGFDGEDFNGEDFDHRLEITIKRARAVCQ